jgi:hypothetical protein
MKQTYKIGSAAYCDISNDEGGIVCDEHATDDTSANDLYERFCGVSADGVQWPEDATEDQIRAASRADWESKITAGTEQNTEAAPAGRHTLGPWKAEGSWISASFTPGQPMVAHTVSDHYGSASEAGANAKLIASAPEMLAALESCANAFNPLLCELRPEHDAGSSLRMKVLEIQKQARAIIAQAKGAV